MASSKLNQCCEDSSSKYSHILRLCGLGLEQEFGGGGHNSAHNVFPLTPSLWGH